MPANEALLKAKAAAIKPLELDSRARRSQQLACIRLEWIRLGLRLGGKELRRTIELNPG
jgi:hypothetical protein